MSTVAYVKAIAISVAMGLAAFGQTGTANADVRNTYSGAECVAMYAAEAKNLFYGGGVDNAHGDQMEVRCPIVKTIFNSTKRITVAIAATGGTRCRLVSHDVFTFANSKISDYVTFPGNAVSGREVTIPESLRGATELSCLLQHGDRILNYLVQEFE
jgi:hypothetical protein